MIREKKNSTYWRTWYLDRCNSREISWSWVGKHVSSRWWIFDHDKIWDRLRNIIQYRSRSWDDDQWQIRSHSLYHLVIYVLGTYDNREDYHMCKWSLNRWHFDTWHFVYKRPCQNYIHLHLSWQWVVTWQSWHTFCYTDVLCVYTLICWSPNLGGFQRNI